MVILQDVLVNLHLVRTRDFTMMRLKSRLVLIIVIALDRPVGVQRARFEQLPSSFILNLHVQPRAPRRIRRGQLVPGEVLYHHIEFVTASSGTHISYA